MRIAVTVIGAAFGLLVPLDDPSVVLLYHDDETHRHWEPSGEWELLNPTRDPSSF